MHDAIFRIVAFMDSYRTIILSGSLVLLSSIVLALWHHTFRLQTALRDLADKNTSGVPACGEPDREREARMRDIDRQIAEERERITMLQKMLVEAKEKHVAQIAAAERSLQTSLERLSRQVESLKGECPPADRPLPDMTAAPDSPPADAAKAKERLPI